jgi:hypothetical protein
MHRPGHQAVTFHAAQGPGEREAPDVLGALLAREIRGNAVLTLPRHPGRA